MGINFSKIERQPSSTMVFSLFYGPAPLIGSRAQTSTKGAGALTVNQDHAGPANESHLTSHIVTGNNPHRSIRFFSSTGLGSVTRQDFGFS
jgi:hypothetical protein